MLAVFLTDASTAKNLELIQNARDPKSGHCLYGVLNHTKTSGGGNVTSETLLLLNFYTVKTLIWRR